MVKRSTKLIDLVWKYLSEFWVLKRSEMINLSIVTSARLIMFPATGNLFPSHVENYIRSSSSTTLTYYNTNDENIVTSIRTETYISVEDIFQNFIDCCYDIDKLIEYFKVVLLHELGHIKYAMNNDIGKSCDYLKEEFDEASKPSRPYPNKPRRNASIESRMDFIRWLHEDFPSEVRANENAGLSIDDILRVEKYLLE